MKARVKATGEIVNVLRFGDIYYPRSVTSNETYHAWELDFIDEEDDTLDYWARLEHQYAGMAMHAILLFYGNAKVNDDYCAEEAKYYAHALVEKMKEEKK